MAQNERENLKALVLVELANELIRCPDICITPFPKASSVEWGVSGIISNRGTYFSKPIDSR